MPGLTAQLVRRDRDVALQNFMTAQRLMIHAPDYRAVVDMSSGGCTVGHVAYPEYPIAVYRSAWYTVCVEGNIQPDADVPLADDVAALARAVLGEQPAAESVVRDWILAHDGDYFIVLATNTGNRLCAVTDPLGRLPVYFAANGRGLWLGRECKFVQAAKGGGGFDRVGWAQHLWLGYPLGDRTLFEGVRRAGGGFLVEARLESDGVQSAWRELWTLNCEVKTRPAKPLRERAAELVETFVRSVERGRPATDRRAVLALSGGFDSRAVAGAMAKVGGQWIATTRLNANGSNRADAEIAGRVAAALGVPWYLIELGAADDKDPARLVRMKDGLNYVGLANMLPFLERVAAQWGRSTTYVTGDGGDKIFPDLRPNHWVRGVGGLVKAIQRDHACLPADTAERIMRLERGTLESELRELLRGYPEGDPVQKAVHFAIYERGRKWLFEGEDRNRFFMWQFSPFYSLPMFRLAMEIPDRAKQHRELYIEFQKQLNPTLATIPYANFRFAIDSPWLPIVLRGLRIGGRLPVGLKAGIRPLILWAGVGQKASGRKRGGDAGSSASQVTDSLMSPEATSAMLGYATDRQRHNWQTLALLERLW